MVGNPFDQFLYKFVTEMRNDNDINIYDDSEVLTFEDIKIRKQKVLSQIHDCQARMKLYTNGLLMDYHRPESFFSVTGVRKLSGYVGSALYAFRILKSLSRVTGIFKRR